MKPIEGFENYSITLDGRVINSKIGKVKKPSNNHAGRGYLYVDLYKNGKRCRKYIHRLVAEAYIDNPLNLPFVNHIDGNTKNNNYKNLEWCSPKENVEHAAKVLKVMNQYHHANEKRRKKIQGTYLTSARQTPIFESVSEAGRLLGIPSSNIVANLKGRQSHTKGIAWMYVEEGRELNGN